MSLAFGKQGFWKDFEQKLMSKEGGGIGTVLMGSLQILKPGLNTQMWSVMSRTRFVVVEAPCIRLKGIPLPIPLTVNDCNLLKPFVKKILS